MTKAIKTMSILGSGWLGMPLAKHFISMGFDVKASTRSTARFAEIKAIGAQPARITIEELDNEIHTFLNANILIINIPSKNIDAFKQLLIAINKSTIKKVLFVSSTSVYENHNKVIAESDELESASHPLIIIEELFKDCDKVKTTIVRFGGLIGYSRHPGRFFSKGNLMQNPDSEVNLIHQDDCIGIISQIIRQDVWGEIFNCCADTHPTKRAFYTQAAKSIGQASPNFTSEETKSFKIISNQKVKQRLNYQFLHPDLMKVKFSESKP